jgi:hypothetical protein
VNHPVIETETATSSEVASLSGTVLEAVRAFASDVSYAVSMSRAAVAIEKKREVWRARIELRTAEATARAQCAQAGGFFCVSQSPCGTGACPFASGDLRNLVLPKCSGSTPRPRASLYDDYSIECAVGPLRDLRAGASRR